MATLSPRQQDAAKVAAQRYQLDATGTVQRNGVPTSTPTGTAATWQTIYTAIPCKIGPHNATAPTMRDDNVTQELDELGTALFPKEWTPDNTPAAPVVIERGDKITVGGIDWYATTGNQQPATGFQALVRVQVSRSIEAVRA